MKERIDNLHNAIFSKQVRERFETVTLYLGVIGFLVHLLLIALKDMDMLPIRPADGILDSPISAIYTPFSFILFYEVFLLLYHLHESFSRAVVKEFEIIALIVVRRLFKDISKLDNTEQWFTSKYNLQLGIDMLGFLLLFLLIYVFYRLRRRSPDSPDSPNVRNFILMKKGLAVLLVPILLGLVIYSLTTWGIEIYQFNQGILDELSDINYVFYDEFFTTLIIADVLILIMSFHYTYHYSQLIRNSGFIVSTVLIRLSFTASGLFNIILVVGGVLFGTLILFIYNQIIRTTYEMEEEY
jgi:hypothetical protein